MYFCPKQGQDFKPPAAPLYPNVGQVPPPGCEHPICIFPHVIRNSNLEDKSGSGETFFLFFLRRDWTEPNQPASNCKKVFLTKKWLDCGQHAVTRQSFGVLRKNRKFVATTEFRATLCHQMQISLLKNWTYNNRHFCYSSDIQIVDPVFVLCAAQWCHRILAW